MKKAVKTSAILIALVLIIIIPLSVWSGFEDLLIDPVALSGSGGGTLNIIGKMLNGPDIKGSYHFDFYQNDGSNTINGGGAILTAMTSKDTNKFVGMGVFTDAGEATIYSPSSSGFGMVKKVLEPSTMLLLGSCLLCIGLFAMKFRK